MKSRSFTLSQERLTCILLILALCVPPRASRAAQSFFVVPDHTNQGAAKLGPVGPALLIVLLSIDNLRITEAQWSLKIAPLVFSAGISRDGTRSV
jgi:hypothetical protein